MFRDQPRLSVLSMFFMLSLTLMGVSAAINTIDGPGEATPVNVTLYGEALCPYTGANLLVVPGIECAQTSMHGVEDACTP